MIFAHLRTSPNILSASQPFGQHFCSCRAPSELNRRQPCIAYEAEEAASKPKFEVHNKTMLTRAFQVGRDHVRSPKAWMLLCFWLLVSCLHLRSSTWKAPFGRCEVSRCGFLCFGCSSFDCNRHVVRCCSRFSESLRSLEYFYAGNLEQQWAWNKGTSTDYNQMARRDVIHCAEFIAWHIERSVRELWTSSLSQFLTFKIWADIHRRWIDIICGRFSSQASCWASNSRMARNIC